MDKSPHLTPTSSICYTAPMELFDYLRQLAKYRYWILASLIICAAAGAFYSSRMPQTYQASLTLYVQSPAEPANPNYFTYDGFYAQQAAVGHTDTVLGILIAKDVLSQAAQSLGQNTVTGSISAAKTTPQLIQVTVSDTSTDQAAKMVAAAVKIGQQHLAELNQPANTKLVLTQLEDQPFTSVSQPPVKKYTLVSALAGLIVAFMVVTVLIYAQAYRQPTSPKAKK